MSGLMSKPQMPAVKHRTKIGRAMEYNSPEGAVIDLIEISEYALDLAYHGNVLCDDRLHVVILRLESDVV